MKNDLGVDPNEWFSNIDIKDPPSGYNSPDWEDTAPSEYEPDFVNPLDSMPIANGSNRYAPPERLAELEAELAKKKKKEWIEENPRPEEEISGWFKDETEPLDIPIEETLHQKMYEIATSKYNPFAVGGSENIHDFDRKD